MIRNLRKQHLQIWAALAILLPVGIISAVFVRPKFPKDQLLQPASVKILPNVLASVDKDDYTVRIRFNSDTSQLQLEWINKSILTYPTATIYKAARGAKSIYDAKLIGRIEARGNYYFNLDSTFKPFDNSAYQLVLYDFIHKQIINSITF